MSTSIKYIKDSFEKEQVPAWTGRTWERTDHKTTCDVTQQHIKSNILVTKFQSFVPEFYLMYKHIYTVEFKS